MWLLEWLLNRYSNVFDWFGSQYWTYRGYVSSIPYYIQNLRDNISASYHDSINQISSRINQFNQSYLQPALGYFKSLIDWAVQKASEASAGVQSALSVANTMIQNARASIINDLRSLYDRSIAFLQSEWSHFKSKTFPEWMNKINLLFSFRDWLVDASRLLDIDFIRKLIREWDSARQTVSMISASPGSFIFGILWSKGLEFLAYLIGYGLGATQAKLPPIPSWGVPITASNIQAPKGKGILIPPLKSLYISGYNFGTGHYGVDYGAQEGEPVFASHDGVVTFADWSTVGYGLCVDLDGGSYWSRYAHLKGFAVSAGQTVSAGQVLGYADSTGNSSGNHLHFELKVNGTYVDPINFV